MGDGRIAEVAGGKTLICDAHFVTGKPEKTALVRPVDIRIGHADLEATSRKAGRKIGRDRALTDTAFVGEHDDDLVNIEKAVFDQHPIMSRLVERANAFLIAELTSMAETAIDAAGGGREHGATRHRDRR